MGKKFIAGALCPQCNQMDKIFVYQQDGEDVAECNACGYISVRPKEVVQQEPQPGSVEEGVVRILPANRKADAERGTE